MTGKRIHLRVKMGKGFRFPISPFLSFGCGSSFAIFASFGVTFGFEAFQWFESILEITKEERMLRTGIEAGIAALGWLFALPILLRSRSG